MFGHPFRKYLSKNCPAVCVCLFLLLVTASVYWPVHTYDFVNFDDDWYVSENPYVKQGLNRQTLLWAFSVKDKDGSHWHPVTWLSHLLDYQLFGMNSGRHHSVNLVIHLANCLLLFLLFKKMTGTLWRSACLAALFALHPINVDTVAWIAERKNVLSTFFWILTLLAYLHYTKQPNFYRYFWMFILFWLGIMTKQMLVTLPFVLLLLDYWPLARWHAGGYKQRLALLIEKMPLVVLSLFLVMMTALARPDMLAGSDSAPMGLRLQNALVSYAAYIGKLLCPVNLAVYYPFPETIPLGHLIGAGMVLTAITSVAWMHRQKGYPVVGWLWYLGTLLPVIGLIQVGLWPAMADRWAYIPCVGLFIMLIWGVMDVFQGYRHQKSVCAALTVITLTVLLVLTSHQVRYWKNSVTLFTHAASIAPHPISLYNLGNALLRQGRYLEAIDAYEAVLKTEPFHARAHNNIGNALLNLNRLQEASAHLNMAFRLTPKDPSLLLNQGLLLFRRERFPESIDFFLRSIAIDSENPKAYYFLGLAMIQTGRLDRGIRFLEKALKIKPGDSHAAESLENARQLKREAVRKITQKQKQIAQMPQDSVLYCELGNLYRDAGKFSKAEEAYQSALHIDPLYAEASAELGISYALHGDYPKAISALESASDLSPDDPDICYTLASVYARNRNTPKAVEWMKKAIEKGFNRWEDMAQDVNLKTVRQDPAFQALLKGAVRELP